MTSITRSSDGDTSRIESLSKSKDLPFVITLRRVSWDDQSQVKLQLCLSYGSNSQAASQDIYTFGTSPTEHDQMVRDFGVWLQDAFLQKTSGKIMHTKLTS